MGNTQSNGYFYAEKGTVYFKTNSVPVFLIRIAFTDEDEAITLADQFNHDLGFNPIAQRHRASFVKEE